MSVGLPPKQEYVNEALPPDFLRLWCLPRYMPYGTRHHYHCTLDHSNVAKLDIPPYDTSAQSWEQSWTRDVVRKELIVIHAIGAAMQ